MAVELTDTSANFTGTGISSTYAASIYANDDDQIAVYVDAAKKTLGDDYVLNGLGSASGISVVAVFPLNSAVYIERVTPIKQEVDTQNNESILQDVLDGALDKLTMMMQERYGEIMRSFLMPKGEEGFPIPDAADRAGLYLAFAAGSGAPILLGGTGGSASEAAMVDVPPLTGDLVSPRRSLIEIINDERSVTRFGALGGGVDDTAAIQRALNYYGAKGGGTVGLPKRYRITDTIRLPAHTELAGLASVRYPFSGGETVSALIADFANPMKWVVEAGTTKNPGGALYGYNERVSGSLGTCNPAYNVGLRNLLVGSMNTIPFGGIRMHGSPGAMVDNVGIVGVGCGMLLNYSFDCRIRIHSMGLYYGFIGWDDINGCELIIYSAQDYAVPATVPNNYRPAFIAALDGAPVGAFAMSTNTHTSRTWGMVFGSTASLSVNNDLRFVSERYAGAAFLINVSGLEVTRFYTEGDVGQVQYGIAAANASFNIRSLHAFMQGGALFDLGAGVSGAVAPGGILNPASFGTGPWAGDSSRLIVHDSAPSPGALCPNPPNPRKVRHPDEPGPWIQVTAGFSNGWGPTASGVYYRLHRGLVELRGAITGGSYGQPAFTIPLGYRPAFGVGLGGPGDGTLGIATTGVVTPYPNGATIGLDGLFYEAA